MTGLRFPSLLAAALCWLAMAASTLAADPFARAALQSKGTIYVGQEVLIDVDVLVPNYFLQPPQFPQFDLAGAIVTLQDGRALNLNETVDGTGYSGIRRTYVVTPQSAGDFALPPAEIPFGYAAEPGQTTQGKVTLPPLRFTVQAAPGTAAGGSGVVAAKVTITQELDRDPKTLKAGDTLVRTVTVHAEGMRAMMIPELDLSAPGGVRLYRQDPALSEETDHNGQAIAGVRKDVASYLFANPGTYVLPSIDLDWFDPATASTQSASAPAVTVSVAAAPALSAIAPPGKTLSPNWLLVGGVSVVAIVAALIIGLCAIGLSRLEAAWEARQSRRSVSEAAFFRHVEDACHDGSAGEIARAIDAWSRKARAVPLAQWLQRFADADTRDVYDHLQRSLYGSSLSALPRRKSAHLLAGVQRARLVWLQTTDQTPGPRTEALPPLNPDFGDSRWGR